MRVALALAAALAVTLGAGSAALAEDADVRITDAGFDPAEVTVHPIGASVRWENVGPGGHSVRFADGIEGPTLAPGSVYARTFAAAGDFPYVCGIHPGMSGMVHVVAVAPAVSSGPPRGGVAPATDASPDGRAGPSTLESVLLAILIMEAAAIGAWAVRHRLDLT
jgi:plastocyanin